MKLYDKRGDELYILYHYSEELETGDTLLIWDDRYDRGLLAYVVSHEYITTMNVLEELVKLELSEYSGGESEAINQEGHSLEALSMVKIAKAKIRMEISRGMLTLWTGWIPTRDVKISKIPYRELVKILGLKKLSRRVLIGKSPDMKGCM